MIGDDDTAQRYYITTAIPYVNAKPHIGHALLFVLTDALARYHRLKGDDVRFQTGTDENSLKNVQAAEREGIPTQALVDRNAGLYYALRDSLSLSFDDFIRTSVEPRHVDGVDKLWQACDRSGDIAKRAYRGLYCVGCEQFYAEDELVDGLCPDHLIRPEIVEEENYFFRLSRYADRLIDAIDSDRLRIVPQTRKNEVLSFIRRGLVDFSISRSKARARGWGIPVPGDPDQVMYVWFDALGNYITALDYAGEGEAYQRYWVNGRIESTSSAKTSSAFTPCTGRRCCSRRACHCRPTSWFTASSPSTGGRSASRSATRSIRSTWRGGTASTRCAIICCARCARRATATSRWSDSSAPTTPTWPINSATCSVAWSVWSIATTAVLCLRQEEFLQFL